MTDDRAKLIERLAEQSAQIAALRDSEATYRRLFDTIDDGFCIAQQIAADPPDFRYLAANAAFQRQTGLGDPTGRTMRELVPEVEDDTMMRYARVAAGGTPESFTTRGLDKEFQIEVLRTDHAGQIAVLFRDITATQRAKIVLSENEARFRALVTAGTYSIYRMSADWTLMYQLDSQTLANTAEPIADWTDKYILPEDRARVEAAMARSIETRSPFELEHRVRLADGSIGWVLSRAVPIIGRDGDITEWFGAGSDVTERRWAAEKLRDSEAKFRGLFEAIDEGFCIIEVIFADDGTAWDYVFREINPAFVQQTGWADAVGKTMREIAPDHEDYWFEIYGRIARTGHPERFEHRAAAIGSWFSVFAFRIDEPHQNRVAVLFNDIEKRKKAEEVLRDAEERQAFLLALSDALRPLTDSGDIEKTATRLLGEHLKADRCFLSPVNDDGQGMVVREEYLRAGASSVLGDYTFAQFGNFVGPELHAGHILAIEDVRAVKGLSQAQRDSYAEVEIGAYLLIPLVRRGRLAAFLTINHRTSRPWSDADKTIAQQTADRLWTARESSRAEAALRESEERFQQFAASSSDAFWIRDAQTFAFRFCSAAVTTIFGVTPAEVIAEPRLINALLVPEDREAASRRVERIARGEQITHEYRIQRSSDHAFRWIRSTGFALRNERGSIGHIAAIVSDITETKRAVEHQGVLMAELQHRVRNIMAIVRSIAARTADSATDVTQYADILAGRFLALSRVQALLTRNANRSVSLRTIIVDELSGQAAHEAQYEVDGPDVEVSPKAAEILTLALHELTTNALKHGALSASTGKIIVRWTLASRHATPWIVLDWTEQGGPPAQTGTGDQPLRRGFGRELIEDRIPYELNGRGTLALTPHGARCQLEFPLMSAASVLETGAPQRAIVFGGLLGMPGEADLSGRRVMVVEDDYYLATDVARALRSVGAQVLGPCANEADAQSTLQRQRPDAVLVDINFGDGPTFAFADMLKQIGVPFAFVTGYDQSIIPARFDGVERLEKPVQPKLVIGAVERLLTPESGSA